MNILFKKAIAEFIGTFTLVFVACGVASITGGSLVATSLAFGLTLIAMAYSVGRVSGCHINPAVSFGCFLTKRMTAKEFGVYVLAQVLGGIVGAIVLFGILKVGHVENYVLLGRNFPITDACNYVVSYGEAEGVSKGGIAATLATEIILTAIFVYTILNVTDEKSAAKKKAGLIIGLTLTLVHLIGINLTGTSVNPARSVATAISALIYNGTTTAIAQVWMFIVAPFIGALVAVSIYKLINEEKK